METEEEEKFVAGRLLIDSFSHHVCDLAAKRSQRRFLALVQSKLKRLVPQQPSSINVDSLITGLRVSEDSAIATAAQSRLLPKSQRTDDTPVPKLARQRPFQHLSIDEQRELLCPLFLVMTCR
jgi:hypothetical protein